MHTDCKILSVFETEFYLCSPIKTAPTHRKSATPLRFVTLFLCILIVLYLFVRFFLPQLLTKSHKNHEPQVITRGSGLLFYDYFFKEFFAAVSVFCISIVIVIGPTPPGTGVIYEALGATES